MEVLGDGSWLGTVLEVFFVDLLLGIDNAVLIALVCRSLRPEHRVEALVFGAAGAVLFRALLAAGIGLILRVPLLHFAGGALLFVIALTLSGGPAPAPVAREGADRQEPTRDLGTGIGLVILADAVMSLDNVLAVGAIARGQTALTLAGLAASVPLVMFGGLLLSRVFERVALLAPIGAIVVGWIAGELAVTDPVIAGWASSQAPAWSVVIPALCALYIGIDAWWAARAPARPAPEGCARLPDDPPGPIREA